MDTHSFFADPDPAVLLNADPDLVFFYADPDPAFKKMKKIILWSKKKILLKSEKSRSWAKFTKKIK